jgi:3-methyladenine DNA glycosylase AlkD
MSTTEERLDRVMAGLKAKADPSQKEGMARYGIATDTALGGITLPTIRAMAKGIGKDHQLALALWSTGVHEARLLAPMIDDPALVTEEQAEAWVGDFRSWDVCDQCCSNLLDKTPFAYPKVVEWTYREEEFVKRAGFVLMATLAVHDKKAPDRTFLEMLPIIEEGAADERNFVKKAVNWALRQIGKRNLALNAAAVEAAERIAEQESRAARWVANDALRELRSEAVLDRLNKKGRRPSP